MGDSTGLMANSNHALLAKLYKELRKEIPGNVCFSPFSIGCALGMALVGMKNNTAKQVHDVLEIPGDTSAVHMEFQSLLGNLKGSDGVTITTANKVYIDKLYTVLSEFTKALRKFYQVSLENVDFQCDSENVRVVINKWIEENTNGIIKELFEKGILNNLTRLVLVNTIYFKGFWDIQFKKASTSKAKFHVNKNEQIDVDMMHMNEELMFGVIQELDCQICQLFYKGNKMSMVLILPNEIDGLSKLEAGLDADTIRSAVSNLREIKVRLSMPKFKVECMFSVKESLQKLGVTDMFDDNADLSGISAANDLFVSDIIHKAVVEVNEEGTEAAAATGLVMIRDSLFIEPRFTANHPFLFYIISEDHTILFMGKMERP